MTGGTGLFISFEGIDGSGKSTQARLLAEHLRSTGREVVLTREPGGSPGAEEIRALVLQGDPERWSAETELLLFTAARSGYFQALDGPARTRLRAGSDRTMIGAPDLRHWSWPSRGFGSMPSARPRLPRGETRG